MEANPDGLGSDVEVVEDMLSKGRKGGKPVGWEIDYLISRLSRGFRILVILEESLTVSNFDARIECLAWVECHSLRRSEKRERRE